EEKLEAIQILSERVVKPLCSAMNARGMDYRMLLLSDHKTLMSTRGHDGDPVPFMIYDSTAKQGSGLPYTERSGLAGPFVDPGTRLMRILFQEETL
ncbi:MAG: phosphoglycerate mutase, partial [Oscillospiraceae bacterium]|nr:phosphoglycerate mutase [Oscillospiraceae bacterium]